MSMRDEVESTIKALKLDRSRIFEVSKIKESNMWISFKELNIHSFWIMEIFIGQIWEMVFNNIYQLEKRNQSGYNQKKATWSK